MSLDERHVFYDYSKYCLERTQAGFEALGTNLAVVMEISALLMLGLRITSSFQTLVPLHPAYLYYGYLVIKLSASFSLVGAIVFGIWGLFPRDIAMVEPLINDSETDQNLRVAIAQRCQEELIQLRSRQTHRAKHLRYALIALSLGIFLAAATTFWAFLFAIADH